MPSLLYQFHGADFYGARACWRRGRRPRRSAYLLSSETGVAKRFRLEALSLYPPPSGAGVKRKHTNLTPSDPDTVEGAYFHRADDMPSPAIPCGGFDVFRPRRVENPNPKVIQFNCQSLYLFGKCLDLSGLYGDVAEE